MQDQIEKMQEAYAVRAQRILVSYRKANKDRILVVSVMVVLGLMSALPWAIILSCQHPDFLWPMAPWQLFCLGVSISSLGLASSTGWGALMGQRFSTLAERELFKFQNKQYPNEQDMIDDFGGVLSLLEKTSLNLFVLNRSSEGWRRKFTMIGCCFGLASVIIGGIAGAYAGIAIGSVTFGFFAFRAAFIAGVDSRVKKC